MNKNELINFFSFRNKFSNNSHKNPGLNFFPSFFEAKKIRIINKSNSNIFPLLNANNKNKDKEILKLNENKQKSLIINKEINMRDKKIMLNLY